MISLCRRSFLIWHGEKLVVDEAYQSALEQIGLKQGMRWENLSSDTLMSKSGTLRSYRISLGAENVYYKRQIIKPWSDSKLKFWSLPSKATVEAWAYCKMNQIGIACPELLAIGEKRFLGVLQSTCIVTREITCSETLVDFAKGNWSQLPPVEKRQVTRQLMNQLAGQLRKAHEHNFFHHDIKWRNLLVKIDQGRYRLYWIDAPRASSKPWRKQRGVVVDLSCLARVALSLLSRYDRIRFLVKYLGKQRQQGEVRKLVNGVNAHLSRRPPKPLKTG